jgi:HAD superfamily hydrolase (TIGR01549 family)
VTGLVVGGVYDAVVFDNDGVLTERTGTAVLRRAAVAAFESFDVSPGKGTVDELLRGVDPAWVTETCERLGVDPEAFWRERDAQFARAQCRAADAGRKPAYDDVSVLEALAVPMGVVSNNQDATIEHLFEVHDLHRHFETWYGREPTLESVHRKKPEPYYVERALADLDAERALYIGDKETDVLAAHAAGADSMLVRRDHNRNLDPEVDPTYDVNSLHAVQRILDE